MTLITNRFKEYATRQILDEICEKHGTQKWAIKIPDGDGFKTSVMCVDCTKEMRDQQEQELTLQADINHQLSRTHRQFSRESIISSELAEASFDTFEITTETDQQALNFAKRQCRHYFSDNGKGNTIFFGRPGVGKSHLTVSMAKALNKSYLDKNNPKSIIFIPVSRLLSKIQESFKGESDFTQERAIKLMSQVDLLFLDDLGKENSMGGSPMQGNEWKQRILFDILDARDKTIINTNFGITELGKIYDPALLDRILKGSKGMTFVYPKDAQSKRW